MADVTLGQILGALIRLDNELDNLTVDLQSKIDSYRKIIESIHGNGLAGEIYSTYMSNYFPADNHNIRSIISHINSQDKPYIKKMIDRISQDISIAQGR